MAPLASFGSLEWLACTSPPPEMTQKKAAPAPVPAKPVANAPKKINQKINLWTQTPPGGLPPPPDYTRSVVKASIPSKPNPPANRRSKYWKKFYRENPMLLKDIWNAYVWSVFSDYNEPEIEPLRSKYWRKQFLKNPERLHKSNSDDEKSCFGSSSDEDDGHFVTDSDSNSDSESDSDGGSSYAARKILAARQRKKAMKRSEKDGSESSEEGSCQCGSEKHVHFADPQKIPRSILKKNTEANKKFRPISPEPESEEVQSQNSSPVVKLTVVYRNGGRNQASEANAKEQGGNGRSQGSRQTQITSDKSTNSHNSQQRHHNNSCTSRDLTRRQNEFITPSNTLLQFYQNLTTPTNFDFHQYQNLSRVAHPFASPLTQSPCNYADFDRATCPFCFSKLRPEFQTFYNPFLGHFVSSLPGKMHSTSASSRCILPVQAQVLLVEHMVEIPTDPAPNAFYDARSGLIRVYHGSTWGNPTGTLLPAHAEQMLSTLGAAMPGGRLGGFPSGFPVGGGLGFTDIQVGRPVAPFQQARMVSQYPATMPGVGMMDPRVASAMMDQTVAQAMGQGYNPYVRGMNMGMGNMNGMKGMGMNNLANQMGNMNMNSTGFNSSGFDSRNTSGIYSGGNFHVDGGNNNGRHFSNNSSNQHQSQNQTQNGNGNANGNVNGNGNSNRNASNFGGSNSNGNNRTQSRNPSQAGGSNNNRSSNSNSGNGGDGGGGDTWCNDNANTWGDNNGTSDPAPAFEDPSAPPPPPSAPPSPTLTVVVTLANDALSSGRVDVVVNEVDEDDGDITPTRETFAHIPGAFPDSAKKNNYSSSNANNNISSFDNVKNDNNASNDDDGWDEIAANVNTNTNDDDDWGGADTGNNNNNNDATWTGRTDETVLSAGSWKSPEGKENNKSNTNGYNLKQVNSSNNDTWGDPTAAQSTGKGSGW